MDRRINAPVGQGGANNAADVKTIQEMLNKALPAWGGPSPKLVPDGICGPLTKTAIRKFQEVQLSTYFSPDGLVEPHKRTLKRLNHIWNVNDPPTGSIHISAEPIDHLVQPTAMTCWATAGTMLVAARDRMCKTIESVMQTADANDPGYVPYPGINGYLALRYDPNRGLPPADTGRYTRSIGLRVGPAACFPVQGWVGLMQRNGAIGVVGLTPGLHIRVITEMKGDGSVFGTFFTIHDPLRRAPYRENFITFTERYEAAATVNDRMDQIWHK